MKIRVLSFTLVFLMSSSASFSQSIAVTGNRTDAANNQTFPNTNVKMEGTITNTNSQGDWDLIEHAGLKAKTKTSIWADSTRIKKIPGLVKFTSRFDASLGLQWLPYSIGAANLSLSFPVGNDVLIFDKMSPEFKNRAVITSDFSYKFNRHWQVSLSYAMDISRQYKYECQAIGLGYNILLNQRERPLMLRPTIFLGKQIFAIDFPKFRSADNIQFDKQYFTARKLKFRVGEVVGIARFAISLDKKISRWGWIYINTGYTYGLVRKNHLYLKEKSGFFSQRMERSVPLSRSEAIVTNNQQPFPADPKWFTNFYLDVGIRILL